MNGHLIWVTEMTICVLVIATYAVVAVLRERR